MSPAVVRAIAALALAVLAPLLTSPPAVASDLKRLPLTSGPAGPTGVAFGQAQGVDSGTGFAASTADLDNDGLPDVVTLDQILSIVGIRINNGDGTFSSTNVAVPPDYLPSAATGDLDKDGDPDIAVATTAGLFLIYLDSGAVHSTKTIAYDNRIEHVELGDLEADGDVDVLATSNLGDYVGLDVVAFYQGPAGKFSPSVIDGADWSEPLIVDPNGDGLLDFFRAPRLVTQQPAGTWKAETLPDTFTWAASGDLDDDGIPDLVTAMDDRMTISRGNGTDFGPATDIPGVRSSDAPRIADMDGDGRDDLFVATGGGGFRVFMQKASVVSIDPAQWLNSGCTYISSAGTWSVVLGDFTGDGMVDIASDDLVVLPQTEQGQAELSVADYPFPPSAYPGDVTLKGALSLTNGGCVPEGETVHIWRRQGADPWVEVGTATTAGEGSSGYYNTLVIESPFTFAAPTPSAGQFDYRATWDGDPRHDPATSPTVPINVAKGTAPLTIQLKTDIIDYGEAAEFVAHLDEPPDSANHSLSFSLTVPPDPAVALGSLNVQPESGDVVAETPQLPRTSILTAFWDGDANWAPAEAYAWIGVRRLIEARLRSYLRKTASGTAIYSQRQTIVYVVGTYPRPKVTTVYLQKFKSGEWHRAAYKDFKPNAQGNLAVGIPGAALVPGMRYRIQAYAGETYEFKGSSSGWSTFVVKK